MESSRNTLPQPLPELNSTGRQREQREPGPLTEAERFCQLISGMRKRGDR